MLKKKYGADLSCGFRKKRIKPTLLFRKMTTPSRRLDYSNKLLTG